MNPVLTLVLERVLISLAYACWGTSDIYPRIHSMGGYCSGHRGVGIGHPLPLSLASQYHIPTCGQPPVLADEPLWPLGGLHHVGLPSFIDLDQDSH